jgi:hypothetical protein
MNSEEHPSVGQRVYRALFRVFGPADVGPSGPPAVSNPDDKTVPAGYHLETITDGSGIRRRIAVPDQPDQGAPDPAERPQPNPADPQ